MHPGDMEKIFMLLRVFVAILISLFTFRCVIIFFRLISSLTD